MSFCQVVAFLAGSPGAGELIVIFLVVLILFGPRRLPRIARALGKALDELRRASQEFRDQIMHIEDQARTESGEDAIVVEPEESGDSADDGENPQPERENGAHDLAG